MELFRSCVVMLSWVSWRGLPLSCPDALPSFPEKSHRDHELSRLFRFLLRLSSPSSPSDRSDTRIVPGAHLLPPTAAAEGSQFGKEKHASMKQASTWGSVKGCFWKAGVVEVGISRLRMYH